MKITVADRSAPETIAAESVAERRPVELLLPIIEEGCCRNLASEREDVV